MHSAKSAAGASRTYIRTAFNASVEPLEPRTLLSTTLLNDINPGAEPSYPGYMVDVGGGVKVFMASDAAHGQELWRTDGTPAGTSLVKDLLPGPRGGTVNNDPKLVNGHVLFWAQDATSGSRQVLYQTDGTAAGTVRVGTAALNGVGNIILSEDGSLAYLLDGSVSQLWRTDGTAAGTFPLLTASRGFGYATAVTGRTLYFSGPDEEPWVTDGTAAGTRRLADINPGTNGSYPRQFTIAGGVTYFWADDGRHGEELWRTDGTTPGTYLAVDVTPGADSSNPWITGLMDGKLYFFNHIDNSGTSNYDLWTSDGTAAGTSRFLSGVNPTSWLADNDTLYLALSGQLWKSDLTTAGTVPVSSAVSGARVFIKLGDGMVFLGTDAAGGEELWRTDGTAAGTVRIADVNPGPASSSPQFDRVVGDTYYFTADDGIHGRELWRTDGTRDGTVRLTDINPGPGSANPAIEYAGADTLYVAADDGVHGIEPWRVDVPTNTAPANLALSFDPPSADEGAAVTLNGRFTDPDAADQHVVHILWGDGSEDVLSLAAGPLTFSTTHVYLDDVPSGTSSDTTTVHVTVSDGPTTARGDADLVVNNVAPQSVTITRIAPRGLVGPVAPGAAYAPGTHLDLAGSFADPGTLDTHTFNWLITSDSLPSPVVIPGTLQQGARTINSLFTPTAAGVYHVRLVVTDDDGGTGSADIAYGADASFVVYDPSDGFLTGGGWIDSPAGAYAADPSLTGKVTFGFDAKYHKGAATPTGNTEFQFHLGKINFKSTDYDWMVIAGSQAQIRGSGTINGRGDYAFILTAIDGGRTTPDQLRIRIWDQSTGATIYDNQAGKPSDGPSATALGGGSIVIHA